MYVYNIVIEMFTIFIIEILFVLHSFDTDDDSDYAMIKRIKMEPEAILSQEDDIMAQLQQESSDLEVEPSFALESSANGEDCNEGVLMQHMDIREPLSTLRNLLEQRLGVELTDYSFWLQDAQMVISVIKQSSEFGNIFAYTYIYFFS